MMDEEVWKWVPGYEGHYAVSNQGRVRSHKDQTEVTGATVMPQRVLKQRLNSNGRPCVNLHMDGEKKTHRVHRLVLEAFTGPPPSGMEASHLNGDPTDNRFENLMWETHAENERRKEGHGILNSGRHNPCAKLDAEAAKEIRLRYASENKTQADLAREYEVSPSLVHQIVHGDAWDWAGGPIRQ